MLESIPKIISDKDIESGFACDPDLEDEEVADQGSVG